MPGSAVKGLVACSAAKLVMLIMALLLRKASRLAGAAEDMVDYFYG